MDDPRGNDYVVATLPEVIEILTETVNNGIQQLISDLDDTTVHYSQRYRIDELTARLQEPLGLIYDLHGLAVSGRSEDVDLLTAMLKEESTQRAIDNLKRAIGDARDFLTEAPRNYADHAKTEAGRYDTMEATAVVGAIAVAIATGNPPVIVILGTIGAAGWLGNKIRDRRSN